MVIVKKCGRCKQLWTDDEESMKDLVIAGNESIHRCVFIGIEACPDCDSTGKVENSAYIILDKSSLVSEENQYMN
jgi:RNA polymerase subunit RPABC4/transcription elongation factor Spt4